MTQNNKLLTEHQGFLVAVLLLAEPYSCVREKWLLYHNIYQWCKITSTHCKYTTVLDIITTTVKTNRNRGINPVIGAVGHDF